MASQPDSSSNDSVVRKSRFGIWVLVLLPIALLIPPFIFALEPPYADEALLLRQMQDRSDIAYIDFETERTHLSSFFAAMRGEHWSGHIVTLKMGVKAKRRIDLPLATFSKLKKLSLSFNISERSVEQLGQLSQLEGLQLMPTRGMGISNDACRHIGKLTNLKKLILVNPNIDDVGFRHLQRLYRLEVLILNDCGITDESLKYVSNFKKLRILDLDRTAVAGAGIAHLRKLPKLERLEVASTHVSDKSIPYLIRLTELHELSLAGTAVTDAGISHLSKLNKLQWVSIANTEVTEVAFRKLRAQLPNWYRRPADLEEHLRIKHARLRAESL